MIVPALTIFAAAPAAAQDVVYRFEQRVAPPGQGDVFTLPVPPPGAGAMIEHRMGLLAVEPFDMAAPMTGAPYTADISTDVVQQLADGNRIEHHTTSSVARDGQGRTRREQQLTAIGAILPQVDGRIITIMDPVSRVHYSLDPARKVAMRSPLPVFTRFSGAGRAGAAFVVAAVVAGAATVTAVAVTINAGSKNARTESLGASQIEGVEAQGTRTVVTIPAGAIGNQAPIEMVTEQWYSAELGAVVLSRRNDPRFGETTYRLQNIVRAEPSPEMFQVPGDYTVDALPAFGRGTFAKPFVAQ
jgi:hypothetical protein